MCAVIKGTRVSSKGLKYVLRPFSSSAGSSAGSAEDEGPGSGPTCTGVAGALLLLPCKDTLRLQHNTSIESGYRFFPNGAWCLRADAVAMGSSKF